jgi:hypothetical protein
MKSVDTEVNNMNLRVILTTIFFLAFFPTTVSAISITEFSFDELYDEADQIVLASVQGIKLYQDEEEFVNANITLYTEDVYKGDIAVGEVIVVSQDLGYGGPQNFRGDMVIVFLIERSGDADYYVLNSHQGLWRISEDGELSGMSSFYTMPEMEEALLQKGWQPDQGYYARTNYVGQVVVNMKEYEYIKKGKNTDESKLSFFTIFVTIIVILAGTTTVIIMIRKKKYNTNV